MFKKKSSKLLLAIFNLLAFTIITHAQTPDTVYYELWELNSLDKIGGHKIKVKGNPKIISTEMGKAIQFNGINDMLLINHNPIADSKEFTIEVIFKPDAAYSFSMSPRFIHIGKINKNRNLIELRINSDEKWCLDEFLKTDEDDIALKDTTLLHNTKEWFHVAVTYKNNTLKTYVNGVEELSDTIGYKNMILKTNGKTSIGARMNKINYYAGTAKTLKITHAALLPHQFLKIKD